MDGLLRKYMYNVHVHVFMNTLYVNIDSYLLTEYWQIKVWGLVIKFYYVGVTSNVFYMQTVDSCYHWMYRYMYMYLVVEGENQEIETIISSVELSSCVRATYLYNVEWVYQRNPQCR